MLTYDLTIFGCYFLSLIAIGYFFHRKNKSLADFALGNRNFSTLAIILTISATNISGSGLFNSVAVTYSSGFYYLFASTGIAFSCLIVAYFLAPKIYKFQGALTVSEIMGISYDYKMRVITAVAGCFISMGFLASQIFTLNSFITYYTDFNPIYSTLLCSLVVIFYSGFGGIKSVTYTDVLQFIILFGSLIILVFFSYKAINPNLKTNQFILPQANKAYLFDNIMLFIYFLFPFIGPAATQRLLMANSTGQAIRTYKYSAYIFILFKVFAGVIAVLILNINANLDKNSVLAFAVNDLIPDYLKVIVITGIFATIMSTADSHLNSASIIIAHDLITPLLRNKNLSKFTLNLTKLITIIIGVGAFIIAISFKDLLSLLLFIKNFWGPIVGPQLVLAILGYKYKANAAFLASIAGLTGFLVWEIYDLYNVYYIGSLIPALICNISILIISNKLMK